jgi:hypothetical protein
MARSKKEQTETNKPSMMGDKYAYGLRVRLGHEEMSKLGMDTMPKVGDKVHLQSHAHVVSASESSHEGDEKPNRSIELEMRHMAIGPHKEGHVDNAAADGAKNAMDSALGELKSKSSKK